MTLLSDEQLAEIEARANAATEGPWILADSTDEASDWFSEFDEPMVVTADSEPGHYSLIAANFTQGESEGADDARFVAAARTDVPKLVAHIRAQAEALERQRANTQRLALQLDALTMCGAEGCYLSMAIFHCHGEDGEHGGECCTAPDIYIVQDNGVAIHRDHVPAALVAGLLATSAELAEQREEIDRVRTVEESEAYRLATGEICKPGQPASCGDFHNGGHCHRERNTAADELAQLRARLTSPDKATVDRLAEALFNDRDPDDEPGRWDVLPEGETKRQFREGVRRMLRAVAPTLTESTSDAETKAFELPWTGRDVEGDRLTVDVHQFEDDPEPTWFVDVCPSNTRAYLTADDARGMAAVLDQAADEADRRNAVVGA